jgi:hypothetical protein
MPIPLKCDCGRSLRVKDDLAGRKVRCPVCKSVLTVPEPDQAIVQRKTITVVPVESPTPTTRASDSDPGTDSESQPIVRRKQSSTPDEDI